jgi:two-component SAPR family response regulator
MKFERHIGFLFLILGCLLCNSGILFAQNRGLHFNGQETVQDQRTGLALNRGAKICLSPQFEMSFDLYFSSNHKDYYGYVFRFVNDKGLNIDLIYDQKPTHPQNFKLVIGDRFSKIAFRLDKTLLFNQWNTFRIKFDILNDRLTFYTGKNVLVENKAGIKNSDCYSFQFGANDHGEFKTMDVPPMNIRDIRIYRQNTLRYFWPLDEAGGNVATDSIDQAPAAVSNPAWINAMHSNWRMVSSFTADGKASVAFDPVKETVHIAGSSSLYSYNVVDSKLQQTANADIHLMPVGSQSVFNPFSGKLYNFYIDEQRISDYNFSAKRWVPEYPAAKALTIFWQANKFLSAKDSALYMIGGYGQRHYKDLVQRYSFRSKKWEVVKTKGDVFRPRYLAGTGTIKNGSIAYVIGGYGSESGQQMLSPKNYYDLMRFEVQTKSFKKIYSLEKPANDFAFASSLVIDSVSKRFYGLVFPNNKYNSRLQLIQGSLEKPEYRLIANRIPYLFHDIRSYADLYWCPISRKLVAVTLLTRQDQRTEVKIYTIAFPPENLVPKRPATQFSLALIAVIALFLAGMVSLTFLYFFRTTSNKAADRIVPVTASQEPVYSSPAQAARPMSVYLFGNMQVIDLDGQDITRLFSPLLKELMLLILLHGSKKEGGISSKQIDEILWSDKSEKGAKNNRSVNLGKLKSLLEKVGDFRINKDTGYWQVEMDDQRVFIDFLKYKAIMRDRNAPDHKKVNDLLTIIQRGVFLAGTEYPWLDDFKSEVSVETVELLLNFSASVSIEKEAEFLVVVASAILNIDPVSEEAMVLKCAALSHMGKSTMARSTYEKFCRDYRLSYDSDYPKAFP